MIVERVFVDRGVGGRVFILLSLSSFSSLVTAERLFASGLGPGLRGEIRGGIEKADGLLRPGDDGF